MRYLIQTRDFEDSIKKIDKKLDRLESSLTEKIEDTHRVNIGYLSLKMTEFIDKTEAWQEDHDRSVVKQRYIIFCSKILITLCVAGLFYIYSDAPGFMMHAISFFFS